MLLPDGTVRDSRPQAADTDGPVDNSGHRWPGGTVLTRNLLRYVEWFLIMDKMDKRKIGPFILEEQIGVGGMGVVYRAIYPKTNKKVAVKILSPGLMAEPKLLSRFEREIKILKRLNHPNIVKYYGGGTENNQRYYAMQFIDGGSLQDVLKQRGRLTWEQAIHVGRQVCSALEHAHNAGIIHRDLKPANLFLSSRGRLLLGDFGIARDTEATALTAAGKTVGTYAYMAPEQINGAHPISGKTDIYALGCLLYEILVGETPFVSDNPAEMLMQHLNDEPHNVSEFVPDCPVWLDSLIDRMLSKEPDDRPFDALAVHTELGEIRDRLAEGNSVAAASAAATVPVGRSATRADREQLRQALGKKKKKKRKKNKDVPLHERTWFLTLCLLALIGLTTYLLWPESSASIHARAALVMEEGTWSEQRAMLPDILSIIERDPDSPWAVDARLWADEIRLGILERQMEKRARGYGTPETRLEKTYVAAYNAEHDLDANPLAAVERYYHTLQELNRQESPPDGLSEDEFRIWKVLFRRRLEQARENVLKDPDVREHFRARLEHAEELNAEGKLDEALLIWDATAGIYRNVDSVADFQRYAQRRRRNRPATMPEVTPPDTDSSELLPGDTDDEI